MKKVTILFTAVAGIALAVMLGNPANASTNPYPQYQVGLIVTYDNPPNGGYALDPDTGQADIMAVTTNDGGCTWVSAPGQMAPSTNLVMAHVRSFTTALFGQEIGTFTAANSNSDTGTYTFRYNGVGSLCG